MTTAPPTDPLELLNGLTREQVRARLDALEAERKALHVVLRSIAAREREMIRRQAKGARRA
jgi:hypothetical protein